MGFKAHPIGLRLGLHRKWKSNWFFDSKNYAKFIHLNLDIENFFKDLLHSSPRKTLLINCQLIKLATNHLFIFIFYYRIRQKYKQLLPRKIFWKSKIKLEKWRLHLKKYFLFELLKKKNIHFFNKKYYNKLLSKILKNIYLKKSITSLVPFPNIFILKNFNIFKNNYTNYEYISNKFKNFYKNFYLIFKKIYFFKKNLKLWKNFFKTFFLKLKMLRILNRYFLYFYKNIGYVYFKKFFFKNYNNMLSFYNLNYLRSNFKYLKFGKYYFKCLRQYKQKFNCYKKFKKKKSSKKLLLKKKTFLKFNSFKVCFLKYIKSKPKFFRKKKKIYTQFKLLGSFYNIKKFLSKLINSKINLIFINTLSFAKFFYIFSQHKQKFKRRAEKYNVLELQRVMINRYKYDVIFIKDFIHIAFISILFKNLNCLVWFIGQQFKRLPKNRKQFKLLKFVQQSLKIFCQQRKEFLGLKFQLKGCLNRRNRTRRWVFKKGLLPIQTHRTRVEYSFSKCWTRRGALGIKLWFFYKRSFKSRFKKRFLEYLFYTKYKQQIRSTLHFYVIPKHSFLKNKGKFKKNYTLNVKNKSFSNSKEIFKKVTQNTLGLDKKQKIIPNFKKNLILNIKNTGVTNLKEVFKKETSNKLELDNNDVVKKQIFTITPEFQKKIVLNIKNKADQILKKFLKKIKPLTLKSNKNIFRGKRF